MDPQAPATMQAALLTEIGGPLVIERVPTPRPRPGEALIRVRAVALCRSDIHIIAGRTPTKALPLILGHEISGEVAGLGSEPSGDDPVRIGDRVFVNPVIGCGDCEFCAEDRPNLCPGRGLLGIRFDGGMAEYVCAPTANLLRLPPEIGFDAGAMIESGGTAQHAIRSLRLQVPGLLLVIGAGGLGTQAIRLATAGGHRVIAVDPSPAAREAARGAGAVDVFDLEEFDVAHGAIAARHAAPAGFTGAIDCVGSDESVSLCVRALRPGATCALIGLDTDRLTVDRSSELVRKSLEVHGVYTYSPADIAQVAERLASGTVDFLRSVPTGYALAQVNGIISAFASADARPSRIIMNP